MHIYICIFCEVCACDSISQIKCVLIQGSQTKAENVYMCGYAFNYYIYIYLFVFILRIINIYDAYSSLLYLNYFDLKNMIYSCIIFI